MPVTVNMSIPTRRGSAHTGEGRASHSKNKKIEEKLSKDVAGSVRKQSLKATKCFNDVSELLMFSNLSWCKKIESSD